MSLSHQERKVIKSSARRLRPLKNYVGIYFGIQKVRSLSDASLKRLVASEQNLTEINSPVSADKEFSFIYQAILREEKNELYIRLVRGIIEILKHLD